MDREKYKQLLEEARDQVLLRPSKPLKTPKKHAPVRPHLPTLEAIFTRKASKSDQLSRNLTILTHKKTSDLHDYFLAKLKR